MSPPGVAERLALARKALATCAHVAGRTGGAPSRTGAAALDRLLGGGLPAGAAHEIRAARPADAGAATGFALMLAALLAAGRAAVWIADGMAGIEAGAPYRPGLGATGLDPERLLLVAADDAATLLQAAEEALRARGVGAVIAEPYGHPKALDGVALRRLALAAEGSGASLLLLRAGERAGDLPAPFRWGIAAAASRPAEGGGPGPPLLDVSLLKNRLGPTGRWRLSFDPARVLFHEADDGIADTPALPRDRLSRIAGRPAAPPPSFRDGGPDWRRSA
jgi:protein ImuA